MPSSFLEKEKKIMKPEISNKLPGSRIAFHLETYVLIVSRCRVCIQLVCLRNDLILKIRWALRALVIVGVKGNLSDMNSDKLSPANKFPKN